jgi:hypothetical protein
MAVLLAKETGMAGGTLKCRKPQRPEGDVQKTLSDHRNSSGMAGSDHAN